MRRKNKTIFKNGHSSTSAKQKPKRKNTAEEETYIQHLLKERVKELTTLYKAGQILQDETKAVEKVLEKFVSILPAGWQYPDITEARIVTGKRQYKTPGFKINYKHQSADFFISDEKKGVIEVAYRKKTPPEAEGPFLSEERSLINMLAEMLSGYFARNRAMEQLLKEKELSESIINSLPGIFYLFDKNGKYLRWNRNHEILSGYSAEEMRILSPFDFFEEEEKEMIEGRIRKVFKEGYANVEANFKNKAGQKTPYWFNGISIEYEGKPSLLGVGVDISERRRAAEQLLREKELSESIINTLPGIFFISDTDRNQLLWNKNYETVTGYTHDEIANMKADDLVLKEDQQWVNQQAAMAFTEGIADAEATLVCKDGRKIIYYFHAIAINYQDKPCLLGVGIDITERKLANEALHKSEANLHTIFDTTDTIYTLLDNNFQVISFNQRAFDFVKKELHRELKLNTRLLSYFPQKKRQDMQDKLKKVLSGEHVNYESSYTQKNGSVNWYYVRIFPIKSNQGIDLGMMMAISDITEKKLLEQEIMNQKVEEQKKMTRAVLNAQENERNKIGQDLHDNVNQILVGAKLYLGLINNENSGSPDFVNQSLTLIDNAIDEIRSLTRKEVTPSKKISLKAIIQSLVDNTNLRSAVKINFAYASGSLTINADLKLNIYRIVQEAINNILKHAEAKNATVLIKKTKQGLRIMIEDDGKGFVPNLTTYKGIGLSNMLNRVESYNGNLTISSDPGSGCKIEIAIPL